MGLAASQLDNVPVLTKASATSLLLATTNRGSATRITVGGQQYTIPSAITLSTGTTGANGLDAGTVIGFSNSFYVYAIVNQTSFAIALIASLSASGPAMPSGYGTAYKMIGGFQGSAIVTNTIDSVYGLYPNFPGINSPGNGYDANLGWFFGGPAGGNTAQNLISLAGAQMTGGVNIWNVHGAYAPSMIGQYSAGRTLLMNNVESLSLAAESYSKKATGFGCTLISFGLSGSDADYAMQFRYSPAATTSPQSSLGAMWPTHLMTFSATGAMTLGPTYTSANPDIIHAISGRIVAIGSTDETPSEALISATSGGGAGTLQVVTGTLGSISGSTHVVSVQLYITVAQPNSGVGNSTTYVVNAVHNANGGASNSTVGTVTALAGGTTGTTTAPTVAWSGTSANITRSLVITFGSGSHILVKMVVARRGAGTTISIP